MELWVVLLSIALVCLTYYLWRTMTVFSGTGIPHDRPLPFLGNTWNNITRKKHFIFYYQSLYERWADAKYVGIYNFTTPAILIRDVELIKTICVKNFDNFTDHSNFFNGEVDPLFGKSLIGLKGDKWREVRSLLSPAFTSSKMRHMFHLMEDCAKDFSEFLVSNAKQGNVEVEMKDAYLKYTNDVIATCAFGISMNTMKNPNNEFYVLGKKMTNFKGWVLAKMLLIGYYPWLAKLLKISMFDEQTTNFFIEVVKSTIEAREKQGITRPDMIQLLMESREKKDTIQLDLVEMTAQAFIFFFAGFDTTASLMTFTSLGLALHPEIQERLLEEVDEVVKRTNSNPSYDDIQGMVYLDAVLYESLRYYPLGPFLDRVCTKTFELPPAVPGGKPFTLKPGFNVWIPMGLHSDSQHYENPGKYDPDRFLNQKMSVNTPTFLSFGFGPRSCIGNRFGLLETKLVLFHLLAKCKFVKSSKLKLPIDYVKDSMAILVDGGAWIEIKPRECIA